MTRSLTLRRLRGNRSIVFAYFGAALLFVVTSAFSTGFASANHVRILLIQASFIGIVALGQTFVILGGGIDLSIPWTLNGAAILVTLFADGKNGPLVWAIPLVLAMGALVGVINGVGIALLGVSPIIMTLGMNVILSGALLLYTNGSPTAGAPPAIQSLATGRIGPIPADTVLWLALAGLATVVLTWTAFGRHLVRARHESDRGAVLGHRDLPRHRDHLRHLGDERRARRHRPDGIRRPGLPGDGRRVPLLLGRRGRDRRRVDPRRIGPLPRARSPAR